MEPVEEATREDTETGQVVRGDGWFILNLAEASWERDQDLGVWCDLGADDAPFSQFGIGPHLLMPGQPNGRYHAETAQEGFLVLSGECLAIVEGEERRMAMRLYDITTGTSDFIANGVVSHNCFARPTHQYLGFGAGTDFERKIVVKTNAPELLRRELSRKSWTG